MFHRDILTVTGLVLLHEELCTGGEVVYIYVAQGSGLCSCHSNTKSVQCIRVAITTRQVSAVTVHPPSKASSCEPSNGSKNAEVKKKIDHIYPCPSSPHRLCLSSL